MQTAPELPPPSQVRTLGAQVPAHYGEPSGEYDALRRGVAVVDATACGRLIVRGRHAERLLHGLLSADVRKVGPGDARAAVLAQPTGHYIAHMVVVRQAPDAFALLVPPQRGATVRDTLPRYVLALRAHIEDASEAWAHVFVEGPHAREALEAAGAPVPPGDAMFATAGSLDEVAVVRHSHAGEDGYDVVGTPAAVGAIVGRLRAHGARPCGWDALDARRVAAGIAWPDRELGDKTLPLEAGLDYAIDLTKGCFMGYEALAKLVYRGRPPRTLVGLVWSGESGAGDAPVGRGATVLSADDQRAGVVTSEVFSDELGAWVGLALVRRALAEQAAWLRIEGGRPPGRVEALPLVAGSAPPWPPLVS